MKDVAVVEPFPWEAWWSEEFRFHPPFPQRPRLRLALSHNPEVEIIQLFLNGPI